jgi:hypothetical protein
MLFLSLQTLIKPSKNRHLRNLIALCVLLTPIHSLANDHFSSWSDKTICRLAKATPDNIEYQTESASRGLSCGGSNKNSISASSAKVAKALAGIDIENDPNIDFFKPPMAPKPTNQLYWFGKMWKVADYNNDGISDVLYIGTMNAENSVSGSEDTGDICGTKACSGFKPLPSLYLGDKKGQLTYSPQLLIDEREDSGMSLGRQLLVADFNSDDTLDFYVADHGIGTHKGVRDSYFLSQPNGTWIESSDTHLSHSNFRVFDHGGATGDIDNDGDMDIVITELHHQKNGTSFWCLMNDGSGFLKKRKCGGSNAFGLELADMDGDGDLDALVGAHEYGGNQAFTGIVWNNGKGYFSQKTALPQHKKKWGTIPEVSGSDLDNDGDLDIVYSRAGVLYVGTAIQIIENLGNKQFKDHGIFPLVEAPSDFKPIGEGNEWNDFIENIMFRDFDQDGDSDIYLSSGSRKTNGATLINNGEFKFEILSPSESTQYFEDGSQKKILIDLDYARKQAVAKDTAHSNNFSKALSKLPSIEFEGIDAFKAFEIPISLTTSGALIMGFKDIEVDRQHNSPWLKARIHLQYGNQDISTNLCVQYYPEYKFLAPRVSFTRGDWGDVEEYEHSSRGCNGFVGNWEYDNNASKLEAMGIKAVIDDVRLNYRQFLEGISAQSNISAQFLLSQDVN